MTKAHEVSLRRCVAPKVTKYLASDSGRPAGMRKLLEFSKFFEKYENLDLNLLAAKIDECQEG